MQEEIVKMFDLSGKVVMQVVELSGAGGEMGRRTSERLYGLLSRARTADEGAGTGSGGGEEQPTLPVTEQEQTAAAFHRIEDPRRR